MVLNSSLILRNARSAVFAAAFAGGSIKFYAGAQPGAGEAPNGSLVATVALPSPAGTVLNGEFTLSPNVEALVLADAAIVWARISNAAEAWLYDADCGLNASSAALKLDSINVATGGKVTVQSFKLIEP